MAATASLVLRRRRRRRDVILVVAVAATAAASASTAMLGRLASPNGPRAVNPPVDTRTSPPPSAVFATAAATGAGSCSAAKTARPVAPYLLGQLSEDRASACGASSCSCRCTAGAVNAANNAPIYGRQAGNPDKGRSETINRSEKGYKYLHLRSVAWTTFFLSIRPQHVQTPREDPFLVDGNTESAQSLAEVAVEKKKNSSARWDTRVGGDSHHENMTR